MELYGYYSTPCGEFLDVIETGDDYGATWARSFRPNASGRCSTYRARMCEFLSGRPLTSDLSTTPAQHPLLIPDLIRVRHRHSEPGAAAAGMEPARLAKEFGRDVCFHGAVDVINVMRARWTALRRRAADAPGLRRRPLDRRPANHFQTTFRRRTSARCTRRCKKGMRAAARAGGWGATDTRKGSYESL